MITPARTNHRRSDGPGLILMNPKYIHNVGGAIRAASCFDVTRLVWTGGRVLPGGLDRLRPLNPTLDPLAAPGWDGH